MPQTWCECLLREANGARVTREPIGFSELLSESPSGGLKYPTSDVLDSLGAALVRADDDGEPQALRQTLLDKFRRPQIIVKVFV